MLYILSKLLQVDKYLITLISGSCTHYCLKYFKLASQISRIYKGELDIVISIAKEKEELQNVNHSAAPFPLVNLYILCSSSLFLPLTP